MSDELTVSADDQIALWECLRASKPETLRAVEELVRRLPPEQRQVLWELLAVVYKRAKGHLPMPGAIWDILTPEQRALLAEDLRPHEA